MNSEAVKPKKITIMLDQERQLLFTLNALIELEEAYGSIEEAFGRVDKQDLKAIRYLLWAALMHEDPKLTPEKVGTLLTIDNLQKVTESLIHSLAENMPEKDETGQQDLVK